MVNRTPLFALSAALMVVLLVPCSAALQTPPAAAKKTTAAKKAEVTPVSTAAEIANAKSKGMVWVNLGSGVYHKDGEFYGNTKRGNS